MKFGRLSKQTLIPLIGIAENYSTYEDTCEVSHVQVITETCMGCNCYATSPFVAGCEHCSSTCKNCPFYQSEAQYVSKKIKQYKNEKNYFGNKEKVGKSAIKLWIALHFCSPDDFGLVRGITMSKITKLTGLNTRQVKYALKNLTKKGYISPSACIQNCNSAFDVMIADYQKLYAKAEKGGKGYITLSEDNLAEIMAFKNVNELRMYIRLYLTCDETAVKHNNQYQHFSAVKLDVAKKWLPSYLTFSNVKSILSELKKYFSVQESEDAKFSVTFMNTTPGKLLYNEKIEDAKSEVFEYIREINRLVMSKPDSKTLNNMLQLDICCLPKKWKDKMIYIHENSRQVHDLAKLAIEFDLDAVKKAISSIVRNFHFEDKEIISWGALARNYIQGLA